MKNIFTFTVIFLLIATQSFSQIPAGYYDNATGTGETLKTQLFNIISPHTTLSYSDLWNAYYTTDVDNYYENDGSVLDIYSENPNGTDPYNYQFGSDQCGNYDSEGDCYNREHSFPKSWFNNATPMYSDLFHLYPTDGKVNGQRLNYPYGEVSSPTWTSQNGSKLGPCSYPGYTGTVFEPIDEFKGDLARTYFYMATCYEDRIDGWSSAVLDGTSYPCYTSWFLDMLLQWNTQDPVSQKEIDRNNAAYNIQGNRNPYIDHPEWVECVWNNNCAGTVNPPSDLSATGITTSEINLSWNLNSANDNILLAYNTTNTFGTPSGDYTQGNTISGGGIVLYVGNNTSFSHTSLSSQTYYYKLWSYDGTDYSSGITASASPLIGEPSNHVTNFTTLNPSGTSIDVSWTDASGSIIPNGYLIKANYSGSAISMPVDGQPEADATFVKNISSGVQIVTFSSLNSNTSYDFKIFPYTNSGTNINYKTDGTIPSAAGTTTDMPTNCGNETFDGLTTGSSSYSTGSFTGQDGSTWNYINSRTDQNLGSGAAICVRNGYVQSGTIPNGISDITISTQRVFSGSTGDITININGNAVETVPYSDVLQTNTVSGINISGDIVIKLETPDSGDRIIIDDIIWTCNGGSSSNNLPEFTSSPVTSATAGQTYTYNITASDADGDNLIFTAPTKPAWLTLNDNGNGTATLSGTPTNSDAGNNTVSINVSDGTGSVNQNFTITVTAVNTLPEFTSTPVTAADAGQTYTYNITTNDADGDNLTFTAPTKPAWLTLTDNGNGTATLSGTPTNSDAGDNTVSINVSDGTGSVNQNFTIMVTAVNTLPEFTSTPVTAADAGQTYTYNITASDADGDNLIFTTPTKPAWLTLNDNENGTAVLSGTPSNSDAGDNSVILSVSDGTGSVNQEFVITVTAVGSVNSENNDIKIYPNPAKNSVNISSETAIKHIRMLNVLGKTIYQTSKTGFSNKTLILDSYPKGLYFIEITDMNDKVVLRKLVTE